MSNYNQNEPMVEMYIYETMQLIDRLEQLVMESEQTASLDFAIDEIFRIMHTIKGNSMMMLFENIAVVAHRLEDLFDLLRNDSNVEYDLGKITDLALEMIDFVKNEMNKLEMGVKPDGDSTELKNQIVIYLEEIRDKKELSQEESTKEFQEEKKEGQEAKFYLSPKAPDHSVVEDDLAENYYRIRLYYEMDSGMENIRAFTFVHTIKEQIDEILHIPKDVTNDPEACSFIILNGFIVLIKTKMVLSEVEKICQAVSFVTSYDLEQMTGNHYLQMKRLYESNDIEKLLQITEEGFESQGSDSSVVISEPKQIILDDKELEPKEEQEQDDKSLTHLKQEISSQKNKKKQEVENTKTPKFDKPIKPAMISVDVHRVDKLMDLVGELVVSESMVTRNPEILDLHLENFEKAARQFRIIMNELQDTVMSMRMVPLSLTFQKMNRIVRDMKKKTGKDVNLEIIGEHTEVDKNVIENIADPLMHIIRNSVDHGIETVEERVEAGKAEQGKIILEAKHSGGDVWIIVKDDGKGLDREKILDKCEEKDLLNKNRADYSDREVYEMLFEPGFSTKDQVTEFSGRGVGLDVVAKNIKKIGGVVLINSELGIGTEFAIKIPLTLAIINGMMMQVGKTIFSVPIVSIRESFIVREEDVTLDPDGNEMVMVRGQVYPILRLHERFSISTDAHQFKDGIMIMIEENGKEKVFFADAILGEQQLVVKSAPRYLKNVEGLTGFALLGDGRISIILDPDVLVS